MKREFADQYASIEEWHWWFHGRREILGALLSRHLAGRLPVRLVSVGCGPPEGLLWLKPLVGSGGHLVGCDLNSSYHFSPGCGVDYVAGNLESIPLASQSFDVVLASDVLEHLDDDVAGLRESARLLKPRGLLVVTVPAMPSLWGRQDVVSHHRRRYTKSTLSAALDKAGLAGAQITYFNTLLFLPIAGVRWTRSALGRMSPNGSDFDENHPGILNDVLGAVFASERAFIGRFPLPFGTSLLATLRLR
jgi:SAM-dependent methyltransferase